ncbi:hypothetical protein QOT17_017838 [Balamuthia mandrillaris]
MGAKSCNNNKQHSVRSSSEHQIKVFFPAHNELVSVGLFPHRPYHNATGTGEKEDVDVVSKEASNDSDDRFAEE